MASRSLRESSRRAPFRAREAERVFELREKLFTPAAALSLLHDRIHLGKEVREENLFQGIRPAAQTYFKDWELRWHQGGLVDTSIVSSQVACLNCFFPLQSHPEALGQCLSHWFPDLLEMLPIQQTPADQTRHFMAFEWIDSENRLREPGTKTHVDFMFRYRNRARKVCLVLGEWKYGESYAGNASKRYSSRGTDRLDIYRALLDERDCPIRLGRNVPWDVLFFDPFDQLMRIHLLATALGRDHAMEADAVSVFHVAPRCNAELVGRITSPTLADRGNTIHEVWDRCVEEGSFVHCDTEDLLLELARSSPSPQWAHYLELRYGGMR